MARLTAISSSRTSCASSISRRRISARGWPRGARGSARVPHADGDSHGGGHTDGRRAANDHVADGGGHFLVIPAGNVFFVQRQARLVDHDHALRRPFDCFYHVWGLLPDYHWSGSGLPLAEGRGTPRSLAMVGATSRLEICPERAPARTP